MTSLASRQLSRNETHDLSMIIKDRTKVLKAHAEEQAAMCMADFEKKLALAIYAWDQDELAAIYAWDQDELWKKATLEAQKAVDAAQREISKRCEKLGIPKSFAPSIHATWQGRGENALTQRRAELRRVAKTSIEAMTKAAVTKIEKQALDLRTQVVAMGLLSPEAKTFLESLAPVEEAMQMLEFGEIERKLEIEQDKSRDARYRRLYGD